MKEQKGSKKKRSGGHYTEAFKRSVCEEYLQTGVSKMSLLKKYNIQYKSAVQKWMRVYGYEDIYKKARHLGTQTLLHLAAKEKNTSSASIDLFKARIKELEKLLADEQLRSEAFDQMITIAEKEFNFPIRKKPNTK